jgi:3-deoxy-D-manno-octulosonic-acid transferase
VGIGVRTIYNLIFRIWLLIATPFDLIRASNRGAGWDDLAQRRGSYDRSLKQALTNRHVLWLHAWTAAENALCTHLVRAIEARLPNLKLVVSTEDERNLPELRRVLPPHISKILFPLDRKHWVSRAMSVMNPEAVVLLEADMRPNFFWRARASRTPIFVVSARGRHRKRRRYRWLAPLYRPLFGLLAGVAVENSKEEAAFVKLGCSKNAVRVVGPLPVEPVRLFERYPVNVPGILAQVGVEPAVPVLIAAGISQEELTPVLNSFQNVRSLVPKLFLVLVPEHVERSREMGSGLEARGIKFMYRNQVLRDTRSQPDSFQCLLVNTRLESRQYYRHAAAVIAGDSLSTTDNGQGLLDAAAAAKPIVVAAFGSSAEKSVMADLLCQRGGAVRATTTDELEKLLTAWFADETSANSWATPRWLYLARYNRRSTRPST